MAVDITQAALAQGPSGATGPGYGGTSATSLAIAYTTQTLITQPGMAWNAGARVRLISAASAAIDPPTNWMEGPINSYDSDTGELVFSVVLLDGAGTLSDWLLSLSIDVKFAHRAPVTLTDASTVAVDAAAGDLFRLALTGSHTLGNPSGATDGDSFIVEVTWGGSYTLTLDTKFLVASNVDFVGAQTSGVIMELGAVYHEASDKFRVVAVSMF